jgi:hypothetical protein
MGFLEATDSAPLTDPEIDFILCPTSFESCLIPHEISERLVLILS